MVLLILLICPSLLSTRHGQHLNAYTRAEAGGKVVVEVEGKRIMLVGFRLLIFLPPSVSYSFLL